MGTSQSRPRCQFGKRLDESTPQASLVSDLGRKPDRRKRHRYPASEARIDPALAAYHVAMVRHHFPRPRRRSVQPIEIFLGREYLIALELVEHEEALRVVGARPSRPALETGNTQPLRNVLVRMPVAEFRALLGGNVPPHGEGCLPQKRHPDLDV